MPDQELSMLKNQLYSQWVYIGLVALYSILFLYLLFKRVWKISKLSYFAKGLLAYTYLLIITRIISFIFPIYAYHIYKLQIDSPLGFNVTQAILLTVGESSISSCSYSFNFIWLGFLDEVSSNINKFYALGLVTIWVLNLSFAYPITSDAEDIENYYYSFSGSVAILLFLTVMGITVSTKVIRNFGSYVKDTSIRRKFQIKGVLTVLIGFMLMAKTAIRIYLLMEILNSNEETEYYVTLMYYLFEFIVIVILNSIFQTGQKMLSTFQLQQQQYIALS
eukprot:TRINITY_DN2119_c0_g1_i2.p1 TRINITY_DN2119_c0_g1~~TRINITY_DN2119_c0_g1_i2.p1  ORF type:complete len:277 (-),score=-5.63 TRINITY_DN2119_c0_g1_i2:94-924(-)